MIKIKTQLEWDIISPQKLKISFLFLAWGSFLDSLTTILLYILLHSLCLLMSEWFLLTPEIMSHRLFYILCQRKEIASLLIQKWLLKIPNILWCLYWFMLS